MVVAMAIMVVAAVAVQAAALSAVKYYSRKPAREGRDGQRGVSVCWKDGQVKVAGGKGKGG